MKNKHYYPILTYIHYVLPKQRYKFSYVKMQEYVEDFTRRSYTIPTLRKEMCYLRSADFIASKKRYTKTVPILTTNGKLFIAPALPKMKQEPWDGKWRVVVANVPTIERDLYQKLQKKMVDYNFCRALRGTYISPYPNLGVVHRYSTELGLRQFLMLFETLSVEQEARTIQRFWDTDELNKKYRNFISTARKFSKKKDCDEWPLKAKYLERTFIDIYSTDPNLPEELLGPNWSAPKAMRVFRKITKSY